LVRNALKLDERGNNQLATKPNLGREGVWRAKQGKKKRETAQRGNPLNGGDRHRKTHEVFRGVFSTPRFPLGIKREKKKGASSTIKPR